MKCMTCGKSPMTDAVTLIRQNPKGEAGIWACESCNPNPVDEELAKAIATIQFVGNKVNLQ